jgi:hypothetical protein
MSISALQSSSLGCDRFMQRISLARDPLLFLECKLRDNSKGFPCEITARPL